MRGEWRYSGVIMKRFKISGWLNGLWFCGIYGAMLVFGDVVYAQDEAEINAQTTPEVAQKWHSIATTQVRDERVQDKSWDAIAESDASHPEKDLAKSHWNEIPDSVVAGDSKKSSGTLKFSDIPDTGAADGGDEDLSRTWTAPDLATQVQRDAVLPSVMSGGIFVPTMTGGINEPKYLVLDGHGKVVKESYTGESVYVPQGRYTVKVGSLLTQGQLEFAVNVVEGSVTHVPVKWSGLLIKVVNDRGAMIRGNYEIVSLPERSYIGLGTGALVNEGEHLSTWLLWPGRYMVISAGEGYQARKNFITVDILPGELSRVTLVMDEDSGDILGGGEIDNIEEKDEARWWWAGILVGGSVRFNDTRNVVGKAAGQLLDVSAFLESYFTLGLDRHFLYARLNAEIGGTIRFEERPFITTVDELNLELLYTYRVVDWFGPYARFAFESNMAPAYQELTTPHVVEQRDGDGNVISRQENKLEVKLSPSFSPITLNTGVGGRFDYSVAWFKFNARLGIAYRHVFARDLYIIDHIDDDTDTVIIDPVNDSSQFGVEGSVALEMTPLRWFSLKADVSVIDPFEDYANPVVDFNLDAAIRLSSIASISYNLRVNYDVSMIREVQVDQYVQLRFSYKIY